MGYGGKIGEVVGDFISHPLGENSALGRITSDFISHPFGENGPLSALNSMVPAVVGFGFGGPLGASLGLEGTAASVVGGTLAGGMTGKAMGQGFLPGAIGGGLGGYSGGIGGGFASPVNAAPGIAAPSAAPGVGSLGYYSPEMAFSELAQGGSLLQGGGSSLVGGGGLQAGAGLAGGMEGSLASTFPGLAGSVGAGAAGGLSIPAAGGIQYAGAMPFGRQLMQPFAQGLQALGFPEAGASVGAMNPLTGNGVGTALNVGSGLYGLMQSEQLRQQAMMADPLAQQRAGYARQLAELQRNPSSVTTLPGYEAGLEAVQRSMAAQGYQGSGNMMAALQQYGGNAYQQQLQNLYQLAGGNQPATAIQGQIAANQLAGRSLGTLGYAAKF